MWERLRAKLKNDYPPSILLVSWKCRKILGFTVRTYRYYKEDKSGSGQYLSDVRLDFYNEPQRTMFLLKYGDYIDRNCQETDR